MKNLIQEVKKRKLTMGCEFTFWPRKSRNSSQNPSRLVKRAYPKDTPKWMLQRAISEDRLFECPSEVAKTFENLKEQWRQFDKVVKKNGGAYRYYQYDSGGGHIHLKNPFNNNKDKHLKFKKVLLTLISNHPEIIWAFNGPRDNHNAKIPALFEFSLAGWTLTPSQRREATHSQYGVYFFNFKEWIDIPHAHFKHNIAANCRLLGSIEYRFIDAPSSEFQLELSVAVCAALHLKAIEIVEQGKEIPKLKYSKDDYAKIEWQEARQNLINFANEHGLPVNRMVQQFKNLKLRFFPELYFKGKFKHRELLV